MQKFLFGFLFYLITLPAFATPTLLIVGDSLSAGYGIPLHEGWVSLLKVRLQQQKFSWRVINDSISGDTTSNGLQRLPQSLKQWQPQVVIIELGGNDGLRGLPLALIRHNLQQMIRMAKSAHSKVLLLGVRLPPNYGLEYTTQFQQIFPRLAHEENIAVVPLFLNGIDDKPALMQPDGIHPQTAAQSVMLENVWPALKPLLITDKI